MRYEFINQLVMGYKEMKYIKFMTIYKKIYENEFFFTTEVLRKLGTILPKNLINF